MQVSVASQYAGRNLGGDAPLHVGAGVFTIKMDYAEECGSL